MQLRLSAEKAIKLLLAFKRIFPIGQPYLSYYQGWREWLIGKPDTAIRSWTKGLEAAQKFNVLYEEGLLRVKLGSHLKENPDKCKAHFERAIQIFEKMGAVRELQFAREQLQKMSAYLKIIFRKDGDRTKFLAVTISSPRYLTHLYALMPKS